MRSWAVKECIRIAAAAMTRSPAARGSEARQRIQGFIVRSTVEWTAWRDSNDSSPRGLNGTSLADDGRPC
jgi:hypothetical protein